MRNLQLYVVLVAFVAAVSGSSAWAQSSGPEGPLPDDFLSQESAATQSQERAGAQGTVRSISKGIGSSARKAMGARQTTSALERQTGMAAGETGSGINVWANMSYDYLRNTPSDTGAEDKSDIGSALIGADMTLFDKLILGVSGGGGGTTTTGSDSLGATFDQNRRTLTIAPYLAVILNENFYISASAGYSKSLTGNTSRDSTGAITSNFENQRASTGFASTDLNYLTTLGDWNLTGIVGYSRARVRTAAVIDEQSNTVAGNRRLNGQFYAGGDIGRQFAGFDDGNTITPHLGLRYERDSDVAGIGNNGLRINTGADFQVGPSLTLSLEGEALTLKSGQEGYGATVNAHLAF